MRATFVMIVLLSAAPAFAAVIPGHDPLKSPAPQSAVAKSNAMIENLLKFLVEHKEAELPLECRGYYVRHLHRPMGNNLNRCD
jgi:hypothetical protein